MKTPIKVNSLSLIATCVSISIDEHNEYTEGSVKANGRIIRSLIKKHLPDLANDLALNFHNPYESQSKKKKGLLIYIHSGIEYFLMYN